MPLAPALLAALIQLKGQLLSGGILSGSVSLPLERAAGGDTPVLTLSSPTGVVRLLLDSGASSSMVTPALAQRLGLASRPLASQQIELSGGGSDCGALRPRLIKLPPLVLASSGQPDRVRLNGLEALLMPVAALPAGVDGVLGAPSLRQLPLWIDPQQNRLALGAAALQAARDRNNKPALGTGVAGLWQKADNTSSRASLTIPLRWQHGVPLLYLFSPAGAVPALADTGAEGLFIRAELAALLHPIGPSQSLRLTGFCGEQAVKQRHYAGLTLQQIPQQPVPTATVAAIEIDSPIFAQLGVEAIVGQELLRNHAQLWRLDRESPELEIH